MNAEVAPKQKTYDIIESSEMSHYMTLDEMHKRLIEKIRKAFAKWE